ncbi:hypothetical protein D0X99_04855 [Algoriphagus lacus]|uniref:Uncharacterized protein n=2 Tax=Algoriphagus lacus TaxID=2056311 RepID=A0A418PU49_9BACT|nr:hypothetical protein D0X99_04855 [Algoriphagus lacus]
MYLKDGIEINKIWQQEIDLLEELEEKEEEIKIGFEWIESFHLSRIGNGFEVALGFTELFFPLGGNLLAEIPPEA